METEYVYEGEWSSYTIRRTKRGFVVTFYSRISGEITHREVLLFYTKELQKDIDLDDKWNDFFDYHDIIADRAKHLFGAKLMRKGFVVQ